MAVAADREGGYEHYQPNEREQEEAYGSVAEWLVDTTHEHALSGIPVLPAGTIPPRLRGLSW